MKRDIPASQTLVPWEATEVPKDKLLQVTNQVNMAGMMSQFTLLMTYSHEVFAGLLDEANVTFGRLSDLGERVSALHGALPSIESSFDGDDMVVLTRMNSTGASRFLAANPERQDLFSTASMPSAVNAVRGACFAPPALHLLDPFRGEDDHVPTLSKYSNPNFFLEQWAAEQQAKTDELRAERKKKRAERVARRAERDAQTTAAKPVQKMKKIRYDPQTGERIVEEGDDMAPPLTARTMQPVGSAVPATPREAPVAPPKPAAYTPVNNTSTGLPSNLPPPVSTATAPAFPPAATATTHAVDDKKHKDKKEKKEKKEKKTDTKRPKEDAPLPPSMVAPPANVPSFPPPAQVAPQTAPVVTPAAPVGLPPPMHDQPRKTSAPPVPIPEPTFTAPIPAPPVGGPAPPPPPPAPPAPPAGGPAPPPPPPPSSSGGGGASNDHLAAIRGGASLKKAEPGSGGGGGGGNLEKPVDQRSNLLENIRNGLKLKSAVERKVEAKPTGGAPNSVAEILARRIAIEPDSDDDVDDDTDGWSD